MGILPEMAVGALQALFGMDVHHVDGLAGVGTGLDELAFALLAPLLWIVGRDGLALRVEQVAFAVALQDRAEIPAMAMIVRELRVLQQRIEVIDVAQEFE